MLSPPLDHASNVTGANSLGTENHGGTVYIGVHGTQGRMGNYMMQYSSGLGLVHKLRERGGGSIKVRFCITLNTIRKRRNIHDIFTGPFADLCPFKMKFQQWTEINNTYRADLVDQAYNCSLHNPVCGFKMLGYWSSYHYFETLDRMYLRQIWNLTGTFRNFATDSMSRNMDRAAIHIGVHVRRGDMMAVAAYDFPKDEYFHRAMNYYRDKYNNNSKVHFWIASDDKPWCQHTFGNKQDVFIIPKESLPANDLYILSNCHHVIQSIGTFSWWAAYLSDTDESIYPKDAYSKPYWTKQRIDDFLLPTWVGI